MRKGDLFVRSCASVLRACFDSVCSVTSIVGALSLSTLLLGLFCMCSCTKCVCMVFMFCLMDSFVV